MFTSIVQDLKALLSSESLLKESKKLDGLITQFNQLKNEAGAEEDVNQLLANDLINELKKKLVDEKEQLKKAADAVKDKKEALIIELEQLIANEQNIGKAFGDLKVIREQWTLLNEKAPLEQKDVDRKFTKALEDFYYNINIYKAIKDHDLKRNQQLKEEILKKIEKASTTPTSKALMNDIKKLKSEWESVGPVTKELQDDYWNKYRGFLDIIYSNFKDFKESEKEEQLVNLNKKKAIIDYLKQIDVDNIKSVKDWKSKGKKVLNKQEEWKAIGFVPKEAKDESWQEYRTACDVFFNAKKAFFEEQKQLYKVNKKSKTDLCKEAEELLLSENLHELTKVFVDLQNKWKKIGPVHQRDEQYLWHRFQKACNSFFQKKKESKKQMDSEKDSINTEKENIINELKEATIDNETQLIEFIVKWWATNRDHTRKSNQLQKDFSKLLESNLSGKSVQEFENEHLDQKIEVYKEFNDNSDMLAREQKLIHEKISTLQKDVGQYENNLSFFGNSKGAEALMKDVYNKMDILKAQIDGLKKQSKAIREAMR